MKKVVIIEDNLDFAKGLEFLINFSQHYQVIGMYESCELALTSLATDEPDIVLLDIDLPGISGIQGIPQIKALLPKADIVMVTVFENSERVFEALSVGAIGYITKNSGPREVIEALDLLVKGGAPMSANIARMVVQSFKKKATPTDLTPRETEILQWLSGGKSYKTIANQLMITLDTVKYHIKNIYIKLQVSNKEDAIQRARDNNWF